MLELGSRFVVMGDWDTNPEPPDKIVIRMPPAPPGVYGCWNKTTRMCVEAMERRLKPGMSFLDFGTGSGILAIVAHHLGASPIYATEHDRAVAKFAQEVWELNQIKANLLAIDVDYQPNRLDQGDPRLVFETAPGFTSTVDEIIPISRTVLPEVDFCVANIGDQFWDQRHLIKAKTIVNISNEGKEVVVHA